MSKISGYATIGSVQNDDLLVVVDVHDTSMASSGTTKKMTLSQLPGGAGNSLTVIPASGDTTGVTDAANLQSALTSARTAGGGQVKGQPGGVFYINAQLVIGTGTALDMTDCTINLTNATSIGMIRNYALINPAATASDAAITSGTNVISTSLGASAVTGQSVVVTGAGGGAGAANPLCGLISAHTGTTITITNLDGSTLNAGNTVSSAAVSLYTRDRDITLRGGLWVNTLTGGGQAVILFSHLDHYTIDTQGVHATSTGTGFLHLISDGRDGYINARNLFSTVTGQDGVHIDGPHYGLVVNEVTGSIGDDGLSLTASNYPGDVTSGNIVGVHVGTINVTSLERAMIVIAGAGNLVDDVKVTGGLQGTCTYVHCGDDTNTTQTTGGTYGYIDFGRMATSNGLHLYSPSAAYIHVELDYPSGGPQHAVETFAGGSTQTIQTLEISGTHATGSGRVLSHSSSSVTLDHVVLRALRYVNSDNGSCALVWMAGASTSIKTLDIIGCQWICSGNGGYAVLINNASASINQVNFIGGEMTKGLTAIADGGSGSTITTFSGGFSTTAQSVGLGGGSGLKIYALAGLTINGNMNPAFATSGSPAIFLGDQVVINATVTMIARSASEVIDVQGLLLPADLSILSRSNPRDMAYNTNSGLSCGVGPCVSSGSGSAGSWKNLSSGATY